MKNELLKNCLTVLLFALVTFFIHAFINHNISSSISINELMFSYTVNVLMVIAILVLLHVLKRKLKDQLGFIFMGTSLFKFAVFFAVFYPYYRADDVITRVEFATFFIPYAVCLIVESVVLSRTFNRLDE